MQLRALVMVLSIFAMLSVLTACNSNEKPVQVGDAQLPANFADDVRLLEGAIKDQPNNVDALIKLGNLYYDWAQDDENKQNMGGAFDKRIKSIEFYDRALVIDTKNSNVRVDMANLLRLTGQADRAIAEYKTVISQEPTHPQARINYIISLGQDKKDYAGAVREYNELLKVAPDQTRNEDLKKEVEQYSALAKGGKK